MLAANVRDSGPLQFRPHHFLCTLGFEGKGYSDIFVSNFAEITKRLRESPDGDEQIIEVTPFSDSICEPCPNRRGARCDTQSKISDLDRAHASILSLKPGDQLTWSEAKDRIRTNMTIELHRQACAPCGWKTLGICEIALRKLGECANITQT